MKRPYIYRGGRAGSAGAPQGAKIDIEPALSNHQFNVDAAKAAPINQGVMFLVEHRR